MCAEFDRFVISEVDSFWVRIYSENNNKAVINKIK